MNITVILVNLLGDEIGDVGLDAVRVAGAGTETATPDLAGQMSELIDRLNAALADLLLVPALAPMEVRLAMSRALLKPTPHGVVIRLQVRAMDEVAARQANYGLSSGAGTGSARGADAFDDLFALDPEEDTFAGAAPVPPGGKPALRAVGGGLDELDRANQLDGWEALGQAWEMNDIDDDEGGWK